ncbi:MAG: hypothetical protein IT374_07110 [Polyangiaceae bacterium]|nr:hypothetical protein [Polyangiaceae bacterium]
MSPPPSPGVDRRAFVVGAAVALASARAGASRTPPPDLRLLDWSFEDAPPFKRRALVAVPTHLSPGERAPVLVLLHGLGEAKQGPEAGVFAWLDRYGMGSSYARLRHPPLASTHKRKDLSDARARELSELLSRRPLGGLVLVCPFTPNVWSYKSTDGALDHYAAFVRGPLLERVAKEIPEADPARVGLDGCSLGGFVALEVARRRPDGWRSLGVVQPAIAERKVSGYADVLARAAREHRTRLHVESSTYDPYLRVSRLLHEGLISRGVVAALTVPPGPHDQVFLRDVGTLEMLLFHDRALRAES